MTYWSCLILSQALGIMMIYLDTEKFLHPWYTTWICVFYGMRQMLGQIHKCAALLDTCHNSNNYSSGLHHVNFFSLLNLGQRQSPQLKD
jgi:hypothetical protein